MNKRDKKSCMVTRSIEQLSFCFPSREKNATQGDVVFLDKIRQCKEESSQKSLYDSILKKFLKHSEKLDW